VLLPDGVLIHILGYIGIQDLLTKVNKSCRKFNDLISYCSRLWCDFEIDYPIVLTENALCAILRHSRAFNKFILPQGSTLHCNVPDADFTFVTQFMLATNLYWISLPDIQISTLCIFEIYSKC
jgi:hypothetical protein